MSAQQSSTIRLRRVLTDTPLARHHQRAFDFGPVRRPRPIAWTRFDRSRYPAPALGLAAESMRALAVGEYGAVDSFSRLAAALAANGAPLDLVATASRIPADEVRHTEICLRAASVYAGSDVAIDVDRRKIESSWSARMTLDEVDLLVASLSTVGETLAAALLTACLRRATDPLAHAVYSAIAGDEVAHLRLGWFYLTWREPQWSRVQRQRIADYVGDILVRAERQFWQGRDAPSGSKKAARALGVLDSKSQRAVVRRVMEDEIVPGLDALGLGASHAWRVRQRGVTA